MIPEPFKTALLIFVCILDVVMFDRHTKEGRWMKGAIYFGLSIFFCYLLAKRLTP